jgi:hypothetical protein
MSTEQRPPAQPSIEDTVRTAPVDTAYPAGSGAEWGAQPQQPKRKRSIKTIAIAAAVALGIAGAGAGVVYAASGSTSDSTQGQGPGGQGGMGGGPGGQSGQGGMGLMNALHGEFVVSDGNSGYTTELMQNGDVTAISDSSVTVKSDDGYTKTYTIESSTDVSDIATGDEVMVVATESGSTATVETISEAGTTGQGGQMGQAPPGQSGNSSSSGSSSSSSGN